MPVECNLENDCHCDDLLSCFAHVGLCYLAMRFV